MALVLVVAIHQVLVFENRVRRLTGDAELMRARERFDEVGPDAKALRDLVAHLDEYAVGVGKRQKGQEPTLSEPYLSPFPYWLGSGGTVLNLGDQQLDLRAAASAAVELAQVVERVRIKYLGRAGQEADAALRRRFPLPPPPE